MQELRFDGRTAIVTGGGSGIGRAHALLLASRGANVVVNDVGWSGYARNRADGADRAETVAAEIRQAGGSAVSHRGDITRDEDCVSLADLAVSEFGGIDVVVNNAGIAERLRTPVQELPNDETIELLDVHFLAPLRVTRAAWPAMERAGHGRVLVTGSAGALGGFHPEPGGRPTGAYGAAKCALFAATRQLALAGAPSGINVNMVLPWGATPLSAETLNGSAFSRWVIANMPPEKAVAGVLWFLHDSCPVNGEFISTAGGRVSRVTFAESVGYFNPDLSPEDVRDNWEQVRGPAGDGTTLPDMFELTGQPRQQRALEEIFGAPEPC